MSSTIAASDGDYVLSMRNSTALAAPQSVASSSLPAMNLSHAPEAGTYTDLTLPALTFDGLA